MMIVFGVQGEFQCIHGAPPKYTGPVLDCESELANNMLAEAP